MSLLDFIIGILPLKQTFLITSDVIVNGSFTCNGSGIVMGRIDGNVSVDGKITVAEIGIINGNIKAADLIIKGTITGNIYCEGKMIVSATANIKGDVLAGEIQLEKNAMIDGNFTKLAEKDSVEVKDFIKGLTAPTTPSVIVKNDIAVKSAPSDEKPKEQSAQTWF